ncbi:unnamed protein product [Chrysoparadoxa australica]
MNELAGELALASRARPKPTKSWRDQHLLAVQTVVEAVRDSLPSEARQGNDQPSPLLAMLHAELLNEATHYLTLLQGVSAHGWDFIDAEVSRLQDQGSHVPHGFQSRLEVAQNLRVLHAEARRFSRERDQPKDEGEPPDRGRGEAKDTNQRGRGFMYLAMVVSVVSGAILYFALGTRTTKNRVRKRVASRAAKSIGTYEKPSLRATTLTAVRSAGSSLEAAVQLFWRRLHRQGPQVAASCRRRICRSWLPQAGSLWLSKGSAKSGKERKGRSLRQQRPQQPASPGTSKSSSGKPKASLAAKACLAKEKATMSDHLPDKLGGVEPLLVDGALKTCPQSPVLSAESEADAAAGAARAVAKASQVASKMPSSRDDARMAPKHEGVKPPAQAFGHAVASKDCLIDRTSNSSLSSADVSRRAANTAQEVATANGCSVESMREELPPCVLRELLAEDDLTSGAGAGFHAGGSPPSAPESTEWREVGAVGKRTRKREGSPVGIARQSLAGHEGACRATAGQKARSNKGKAASGATSHRRHQGQAQGTDRRGDTPTRHAKSRSPDGASIRSSTGRRVKTSNNTSPSNAVKPPKAAAATPPAGAAAAADRNRNGGASNRGQSHSPQGITRSRNPGASWAMLAAPASVERSSRCYSVPTSEQMASTGIGHGGPTAPPSHDAAQAIRPEELRVFIPKFEPAMEQVQHGVMMQPQQFAPPQMPMGGPHPPPNQPMLQQPPQGQGYQPMAPPLRVSPMPGMMMGMSRYAVPLVSSPYSMPSGSEQPGAPYMMGPSSSPVAAGMDILEALRMQVEFYFSAQNLAKDVYLRKKMDPEGLVPLGEIMAFNRVRNLTQDPVALLEALKYSNTLELRFPDSQEAHAAGILGVKIRTKDRPERYVWEHGGDNSITPLDP